MAEALWFGAFMMTAGWFWIMTTIGVILLFALIENEFGFGALMVLLVFAFLCHIGGVFNVVVYLFADPVKSLITIAGYFAFGTAWTIFKFKLYTRKLRIRINEDLKTGRSSIHTWDTNWLEHSKEEMLVKSNKANLMRWAGWWPVSIVWTLLRDLLYDIWEWIITDILGKLLQRISADELAKIEDGPSKPDTKSTIINTTTTKPDTE